MDSNKQIIDYSKSYQEGTEGIIPAYKLSRDDAIEYHHVELYNPPGSISCGLKWKCERCGRYYANPKFYEKEPCIPFKNRE